MGGFSIGSDRHRHRQEYLQHRQASTRASSSIDKYFQTSTKASSSIFKYFQTSSSLTIGLLLNAFQIILPILCPFPFDRHGFVFHFTVQPNSSFFLFRFSFFLFHRLHRIHRSLTTATHTSVLFVVPVVCFAETDSFQRYLRSQLDDRTV